MTTRPLTDATMAATLLLPQIVGECVLAEHGREGHDAQHRRLTCAIEKAAELKARLEAAQLLHAARPMEERNEDA